jgi:Ca-activated chloride channel family protein
MNIKNPQILFLYLILILVLFAFIYLYKKRKQLVSSFKNANNLKTFLKGFSLEKFFFRLVIWFLILFFMITALVSPRFGYEWKEVNSVGANIIFAIDVSKSMLATDIGPNRLARAKIEVAKLIDKFQGDRSGLIIFARDAYLLTPLTHDYGIIKEWLERTDTDSVSNQGTSIKSAIALARESFAPIKSDEKALILISDGEEHDEETIAEAKLALSEGIKIFTIGVGTEKGSPIQLQGSLLKDNNNQVVISKLQDTLLKEIALATEAKYTRSATGDFHLDQLYFESIRKDINPEKLQSGMLKKWKETFQIFSLIAFVLLLIDTLMSLNLNISLKSLFRRKSIYEKGLKK